MSTLTLARENSYKRQRAVQFIAVLLLLSSDVSQTLKLTPVQTLTKASKTAEKGKTLSRVCGDVKNLASDPDVDPLVLLGNQSIKRLEDILNSVIGADDSSKQVRLLS